MSRRRLRNAGSRHEAQFGAEAGAILAAAGINAATQLISAGINSSATKEAAKNNAKAINQNAIRQAQAIKDQNQMYKEVQEQSQQFVKEQNAENRELQKDIQMQLQMLTGQQNVNDRYEASKIKVKAGGKLRHKCLNGMQQSLLRGGNMPFTVTDGGGVIPVGLTPEGFELYEIVGNDHDHYHKTRGGKYKSGVGIRFADGNVVEGEGDQRRRAKNGGELMLVTPNDAFFISKHNINGVNPKRLVEQGIHPLQAYAIQEEEKNIMGINDDGSKKYFAGGSPNLYFYDASIGPKTGVDTIGDTAVGMAYAFNNKRSLKCGGKARIKAEGGLRVGNKIWDYSKGTWVTAEPEYDYKYPLSHENQTVVKTPAGTTVNTELSSNTQSGDTTGTTEPTSSGFGNWVNNNANLLGVGINALGNIGGALITSGANRFASRTLADAYNKGANIMADAYNSLQTIDVNSFLDKNDYRAARMLPALQAPVSFAENQIAGVNRLLQRRLANAARYSSSGAAAQKRMADAEIDAQDMRNKIYSEDQNQMQKIRQANVQSVNEAARINAMLETEANKQFGRDYLEVLKYNNDINNQKILGAAGAISEAGINSANIIGQGRTAGAQAWATALANSGLSFSNTLSDMAKQRADLNNVMLGASTEAQVRYLGRNGTPEEKNDYKRRFQNAIDSGKLSKEDENTYRRYIQWLS